MEQSQMWASGLAAAVGQRVAHFRAHNAHGCKLSAQALADRTAELGFALDRSVIAKLEKGHRHTVTVAEVFVLAQALEIPPLLLLLPLGQAETVEILPGVMAEITRALRWLTGESPLPENWWHGTQDGDSTVASFQVHFNRVSTWETSQCYAQRIRDGELKGDLSDIEDHEHRAGRAAEGLRSIRQLMRARGLTPPPLPSSLAFVDEQPPALPKDNQTAGKGRRNLARPAHGR